MVKSKMTLFWSMLWIFLVAICFSCKSEKTTPAQKTAGQSIPEEFLSFYDRFHNDSLFQLDHIVFPLAGKRPDSTGITSWHKESWIMHRPFDDMGIFKRRMNNIQGVIVEKINDARGQYTMERRWNNDGTDYYLIYYKEMGLGN